MKKLLFALLLIPAITFSQTDKWLEEAGKKIVTEKIFIHTDKDYYAAGEVVYFKAFVFAGMYPSVYSSSFYIRLLSEDSSVVIQNTYPVISGTSVGTINVPSNLNEGRYFISAYTNYSAKESGEYGYLSPLLVFNPVSDKKISFSNYQKRPSLKIISPTGNIIQGISNQVYAFLYDQYNQPLTGTVLLKDGSGTVVSSGTTNDVGIKELIFTPSAGKHLFEANWNNQQITIPLPNISVEGISMQVYDETSNYGIILQATASKQSENFELVAEYEYNVLFRSSFNLSEPKSVKIPYSKLPSGIIRLALLDKKGDAVCERYIFSKSSEIHVQEQNVHVSGNSINVTFKEDVEGTVSVLVSDAASQVDLPYKKENILNRFLLTSYLKEPLSFLSGYITDISKVDLSLVNSVLAVHKLNKPDWKYIKEESGKLTIPEEDLDYIRVVGKIEPVGEKSLQGSELNVMIRSADSAQQIFTVPLDDEGKFDLKGMMFVDSATVHYQLNTKRFKHKEVKATITNIPLYSTVNENWSFYNYYIPVTTGNSNQLLKPEQQQKIFRSYSDTITNAEMLQEVTVSAVRTWRAIRKESEERYATGLFAGTASYTFNFISDPPVTGWQSVVDFLRLQSRRRISVQETKIVANLTMMGTVDYTLFLDGAPVDMMVYKTVRIDDVALIKVYAQGFAGAAGNQPAIAVFTKKIEDRKQNSFSAMRLLKLRGYDQAQDFPDPSKPRNNVSTDKYYATLYWNPYVLIDVDGKKIELPFAKVTNADIMVVNVQGMTSDGRLIYHRSNISK